MESTARKKVSIKTYAMGSTKKITKRDDQALSRRKLNLVAKNSERDRQLETFKNLERDRVLSAVTHDLRAPLSNIEGLIDIIQDSPNLSQEDQKYLFLMRDCVTRMSGMVGGILDASSSPLRRATVSLRAEDISRIATHIFECFKPAAAKKNIGLNLELDEGAHLAIADQNHLIQSLENLVCNALKYSESDKDIFLRVRSAGNKVIIEVEDQGPGISEADQQKMFAPFRKLSARPTACESSLGLGLSLVKDYVAQMKGEISCESKLGEGTKFSIALGAKSTDTQN